MPLSMNMRSAANSPFHVVDSHIMNHSPPIVMNARDHNNITEINRKGITAIKPELDLIAALRRKQGPPVGGSTCTYSFHYVRTGCEHRFRVGHGIVRFRIRAGS